MNIREALESQYKEIFQTQLSSYFKKEFIRNSKELLKNSANIGLGFLSLPNIVGGALSFMTEIKAAHFNFNQLLINKKAISNYHYYVEGKESILRDYIIGFDIREETEMIDLIKLIQDTLSEKFTI